MIQRFYRSRAFLAVLALMLILPFTVGEHAGATNNVQKNSTAEESTETTSTEQTSLTEELNAILQDERLAGALTGVSVRNADNGEIVYAHNEDIRLHPASNQKILTGAAALATLGGDYQFSTEILTDGVVRGKVLQGNLYIKGKGDPTLLKKDLDAFAKELKAKGIEKINGDIIGDDSWYDDVRLSTDLNWDDESNYTGAQVSALTLSPNEDYDMGTVIVEVTAGKKAGDQAQVSVTPATDYVNIVTEAATVAKGESKSISISREHGTNDIIIKGKIPLEGSASRSWVSVWEPTGYVLDVFAKSLQEQGIKQIGKNEVKRGVTAKDAVLLATKQSMPLKELFLPFMKLSNNGHAEMIVKAMGKEIHAEGSWEKGLDVVESQLASYGLNMESILLRDGSGMSHKNLIPAEQLTKLLYEIQDEPWYPQFEHSLPVAGISDRLVGGTLRNRLKGENTQGNVKAKTGSLTGANTLSGYVTAKSGEKFIFSIMMNNYISGSMTEIQDRIVETLAKQ
ncbi:D-alanyl-D-alanine carboxypeptidase/D-alanyl-D-alanine endopeptidase [Cytobacillus gottheilii]|uniref:D-alanyl-D-alanine carboxypeptidase/D-alanyl-D-alanine endopeptidase n=1 Tax=Cytobacillus gottheilii TaxID=859144 RepID=UPI0024941103|nr:D-alanyl-D-alanine carboxypeptidase/D-alanyl-D-alanine-endopeptidase [Cytobacillus gottheilii]